MKPGRNDIPVKIKISGRKLEELQCHTIHMCESYGLDTKIEKYKGTRAISLYRWDMECLIDVLFLVLDDKKEYPDKNDPGYIKLNELHLDLKQAYKETY